MSRGAAFQVGNAGLRAGIPERMPARMRSWRPEGPLHGGAIIYTSIGLLAPRVRRSMFSCRISALIALAIFFGALDASAQTGRHSGPLTEATVAAVPAHD